MLYVLFITVPASAHEALSHINRFIIGREYVGLAKLNTPDVRVRSLDQCLSMAERLGTLRKELDQNLPLVKASLQNVLSTLPLEKDSECIRKVLDSRSTTPLRN